MSNNVDFDVNAWEAGANQHAQGEDFDVNKWENANQKTALSPRSVEGRPQIQRPAPPTLSPSEEMPVSQAEQDSVGAGKTAKELGGAAAVGLVGGAAAGPAIEAIPGLIETLTATAKAHPIAVHIIKTGITGLVGGAAFAKGSKLAKLLAE